MNKENVNYSKEASNNQDITNMEVSMQSKNDTGLTKLIAKGQMSPWIRFCIGIGIIIIALSVLAYVVMEKLPPILKLIY